MAYSACATCQFFIDPGNGEQTECRRHPPEIIVVQDEQRRQRINRCMWPHVSTTTGCGEHRAQDAALETQNVSITSVPNLTVTSLPDVTIVSIPSLTISATPVVDFGDNSLDVTILSGSI